ncbi:MAG: dTDP-4-dehydrorhamnose reductase [Candidatus Acidiferrum sp.]
MKPILLLTGKNGQVGRELLRLLPQLGEVVAVGRDELDLSRPDEIRRTIQEVRPHLIVNAAAYTAVDRAEKDKSMARAINAEAPELMAVEAKKIGAGLLHYSTDYVFDGTKRIPYEEADSANPLNVYGETKFAGEQAIRGSGVPHLIFRTAWVYATRGHNFMLTILRLATEREELRIVSDQVGTPTCAADVAAATYKILARISDRNCGQFVLTDVSGTYHMSAAGQTTWYEFAKAILEEGKPTTQAPDWLADATKRCQMIARHVIPISTAEFSSPTQRPAYSVLSNSLLLQKFDVALPDWRVQLKRCFVSDSAAANVAASFGAN